MKKTLLMATGALMAAGFAADAKAVDVELYGQVNKTIISADNGSATEVTIADNDKSSTRVGLKGEQALDNGLTASVLVEYEMQGNATNGDAFTTDGGTASTLTERHARVGLAGDFGAVHIGHTSSATDGIFEIDMAGVSDLLGTDIDAFGGASRLVDGTGANVTTLTVSDAFGSFDGGRANAVAYHSPTINGFQGQLSTTEGGSVQAAVRFSGKMDAFAVKAGLGYEMNEDREDNVTDTLESRIAGSVTVKHDSSLAATYAYGKEGREDSAAEASRHYFKVGYTFDALEVAVDYTVADADQAASNVDANNGGSDAVSAVEGEAWGLGAQYNLGHGVSVAGAYRTMSFDNTVADVEDIDLMMANLRVKF